MTIASKSELRTALNGADGFLHRVYTTPKLDELILMGESRLNRDLRMIDMIDTQTGTLSGATLAIPAGYMDKIQFRITDPETDLVYVVPSEIDKYRLDAAATGMPRHYTVTDTFEFDLVPDSAYGYSLKYFKGFGLVADADTNYLLQTFPQAYMAAVGIYHARHVREWDLAERMEAFLAKEVLAIRKAERRRKGADDTQLTTEFFQRQRFSINQG